MSRRIPRIGLALAVLPLCPQAVLAQANRPAPGRPPAAAQPGTPAAITPAAPTFSASHLGLAREVMLSSGIARSFDSILPAFAEQIRKQAVTRPEITKDLDEVLVGLQPEMQLQKQRMVDIAARTYAAKLSEAELKDIATFFRSASGKRYVETQPQILDEMVHEMQDWTLDVSEYVMVRVRAEMGKRGLQLQ